MKKYLLLIPIALALGAILTRETQMIRQSVLSSIDSAGGLEEPELQHPLMITEMRKRSYPGSEIEIAQELDRGANYSRYLASYKSDGLRINAMLTIPDGEAPEGGWPAIVFNHGWISPSKYKTTERYVAYLDGFAREGFVVIKPDYRGHADSEGEPEGAYFSPGYTADVLNAVSSLAQMEEVNPSRVGMWGHSMGGNILLRAMVVSDQVKAGVSWGGVMASHQDLYLNWNRRRSSEERDRIMSQITGEVEDIFDAVSPINFVDDLSGPIQLHHGLADETVPWEFSQVLADTLGDRGIAHEYFTYENGNHNLSGAAFGPAMQRSVDFFKTHLEN